MTMERDSLVARDSAPERIWAKLDRATVYMDGSSPLVARTREFRGSTAYVRARMAGVTSFDALREAFLRGASWRQRNGLYEGEAEEYLGKAAIDYADIASARLPMTVADESIRAAGETLMRAIEQYGFPVSCGATAGLMKRGSIEAKQLHAAALSFRDALNQSNCGFDDHTGAE